MASFFFLWLFAFADLPGEKVFHRPATRDLSESPPSIEISSISLQYDVFFCPRSPPSSPPWRAQRQPALFAL